MFTKPTKVILPIFDGFLSMGILTLTPAVIRAIDARLPSSTLPHNNFINVVVVIDNAVIRKHIM